MRPSLVRLVPHSSSTRPRTATPFSLRSTSLTAKCASLPFQTAPHHSSPQLSRRPFASSDHTMVATAPREPSFRVVTPATMNKAVQEAQYAVRGAIPLRAEELRDALDEGRTDLPFESIVNCNIGNPQQLDQQPLTFLRQVCSLADYPALIDHPLASQIFPSDAIARAKSLVAEIGSTGAYSHSMGVPAIRKRVAQFISERDGYPASASQIYLTAGASAGVSNIMQTILSSPTDGVLIPIPQYPLYTAALALNSARVVPYYLQESHAWGIDMVELRKELASARADGTTVKAMVVINPGNPTGNCLSASDMTDIVKLCYDERMVLMADEVYQDNIYHPEMPFVSFKQAINDLGAPYAENLELVSFHSISKGQTGECGRRGGYFELVNFSPEAEEQVYKLASIQLCASLGGQIGVDILIAPPKEGDESYPLWIKEKNGIAATLKTRGEALHAAFNELEGVTCNAADGALYLFPTLTLSPKVIAAAAEAKMQPDAFYALRLLEGTGICVVPGSGFGQKPGTWHIRTTFLAETSDFVKRLKEFHAGFMAEFK